MNAINDEDDEEDDEDEEVKELHHDHCQEQGALYAQNSSTYNKQDSPERNLMKMKSQISRRVKVVKKVVKVKTHKK